MGFGLEGVRVAGWQVIRAALRLLERVVERTVGGEAVAAAAAPAHLGLAHLVRGRGRLRVVVRMEFGVRVGNRC